MATVKIIPITAQILPEQKKKINQLKKETQNLDRSNQLSQNKIVRAGLDLFFREYELKHYNRSARNIARNNSK